jgi:hypothetical protein
MHSPTTSAPAVPSGPSCTRADPTAAARRAAARAGCGANYARELKRRVHSFFNNLHISITVGSVEEMRHKPTEQTLRIKNNKTGYCVFQVFVPHPLNLLSEKPPSLLTTKNKQNQIGLWRTPNPAPVP